MILLNDHNNCSKKCNSYLSISSKKFSLNLVKSDIELVRIKERLFVSLLNRIPKYRLYFLDFIFI